MVPKALRLPFEDGKTQGQKTKPYISFMGVLSFTLLEKVSSIRRLSLVL